MPTIHLTTIINAPIERSFDLARSIDLHSFCTAHTGEKAIAGKTSGIISKGETVTWQAKHFGITQTLTSLITEVDYPVLFEDRMVKGAFKNFYHRHYFEQQGDHTIMKDEFVFESPLGIIGKAFNALVLTNYMKRFLNDRNQTLKRVAESGDWKKYLVIKN